MGVRATRKPLPSMSVGATPTTLGALGAIKKGSLSPKEEIRLEEHKKSETEEKESQSPRSRWDTQKMAQTKINPKQPEEEKQGDGIYLCREKEVQRMKEDQKKRDLEEDEALKNEKLDDYNYRMRRKWIESVRRHRDLSPESWLHGDGERKGRMLMRNMMGNHWEMMREVRDILEEGEDRWDKLRAEDIKQNKEER